MDGVTGRRVRGQRWQRLHWQHNAIITVSRHVVAHWGDAAGGTAAIAISSSSAALFLQVDGIKNKNLSMNARLTRCTRIDY